MPNVDAVDVALTRVARRAPALVRDLAADLARAQDGERHHEVSMAWAERHLAEVVAEAMGHRLPRPRTRPRPTEWLLAAVMIGAAA